MPVTPQPGLKRALSPTLLVLYGLGTTVGAGIYVLVGKVAGAAGVYAPLSFLVAAAVALPTALSFGALAARYPRSAGEAVYAEAAFGAPRFATAVGLAVVCVGLVSSATICAGAVGYLQKVVPVPFELGLILVVATLALVAVWGISESVLVTATATALEVACLVLIIWCGRDGLTAARLADAAAAAPPWADIGLAGILSGAILAFYAFIGFEDMVNVAEEVRDPPRVMPRAIAMTLAITAVLYVLVALVSVTAMPVAALAASTSPISDIFSQLTGLPTAALDVVIIAAVANGALVQIIMGARVLYGLAQEGWLPPLFARVDARTQTPWIATWVAAAAVLAMAAAFPLERLARTTSWVTLLIFVVVNASLLRLRLAEPGGWLPAAVPLLGLIASLGLAAFQADEVLWAVFS